MTESQSDPDFMAAIEKFVNGVHVDLRDAMRATLHKKSYEEACATIKYTPQTKEAVSADISEVQQISEHPEDATHEEQDTSQPTKRARRRLPPITGKTEVRQRAAPSQNAVSVSMMSRKERGLQLEETIRRKEASARIETSGSGSIVPNTQSSVWKKVLKRRYGTDITETCLYTPNMNTNQINATASVQFDDA